MRRTLMSLLAAATLTTVLPAHAGAHARNGLIAYDDDAGGGYHLVLADADGRNPRRLAVPMRWALWPAWSPDGRWIAFTALDKKDQDAIFVVRPDGSGLRQLPTLPGGLYMASWSPDGRSVVAAHDGVYDPTYSAEAQSQVVVVPVHGGAPRVVTTVPTGWVSSPVWSPRGDTIVFSVENGAYEPNSDTDVTAALVESVRVDGTGLQVLGRGSAPAVSPDGSLIAYTGMGPEATGAAQVHVMAADGSNDRVLGHFGWYGWWVRFAPDGRSVLCEGQEVAHGVNHVYRLDLASGRRTQLTTGRSDQVLPSQQPVRAR